MPAAAAVSLAAVAAGALAISTRLDGGRAPAGSTGSVRPATPSASRQPDPAGGLSAVPRYYVALTGILYPWYDHPMDVTVRATATGHVLATVRAPAPYGTFSAVAGAADDRAFVLAAQPWQPQSNSSYIDNNSAAPVRFFLLTLSSAGSVSGLSPLPSADVAAPAQFESAALSPDGTKLAVAVAVPAGHSPAGSYRPASQQIRVFTLANPGGQTWSISGPAALHAGIGDLSWAADDRTLAFNWMAPSAGLRLLDTATGHGLLAGSRLALPFLPVDGWWCAGNALLAADGTTIDCPVVRATAHPLNPAKSPGTSPPPGPDPRPTFRQGYGEFSASTGQVLRVIGSYHYGTASINDNGSALLMWASPSGGALIVQDFYPNPLVDIVSSGRSVQIPWSARTSAGQGSTSQASW